MINFLIFIIISIACCPLHIIVILRGITTYFHRIVFHMLFCVSLILLIGGLGLNVGIMGDLFQITTPLIEIGKGLPTLNGYLSELGALVVQLKASIFTVNFISCEASEDLPVIIEFNNLHLTESLLSAKTTLLNQSGIYCIKCVKTGAIYLGSSTNIGERLINHIFNHCSNLHLQHSMALYGLPFFVFLVVELCPPHELLANEQKWLD